MRQAEAVKVGTHNAPAGACHAFELSQGLFTLPHPLQQVLGPHQIKTGVGKWQLQHIAHFKAGIGQLFCSRLPARKVKYLDSRSSPVTMVPGE